MINWVNIIGEQIINVEPVVAEIRMCSVLSFFLLLKIGFFFILAADATCQFTLILTGTRTGQIKVEVPFKLDGIDDYGYFHVEAEIIVTTFFFVMLQVT